MHNMWLATKTFTKNQGLKLLTKSNHTNNLVMALRNSSASICYLISVNNYIVTCTGEPSKQALLLANGIFELGSYT